MIRPASAEDAPILTRIALDAKRHWGYPEHWIKHWERDLTISSQFITENQVFVSETEGEIRGFYALCLDGTKAELEHMWVTPDYIGTGVGKELFLDAMDRASALSVREVGITADPNASGFYERMGATKTGETESSIDGQIRRIPRLKIEPS